MPTSCGLQGTRPCMELGWANELWGGYKISMQARSMKIPIKAFKFILRIRRILTNVILFPQHNIIINIVKGHLHLWVIPENYLTDFSRWIKPENDAIPPTMDSSVMETSTMLIRGYGPELFTILCKLDIVETSLFRIMDNKVMLQWPNQYKFPSESRQCHMKLPYWY